MADVGRSRRKGGDVRDRPPDVLPQPRTVRAEEREMMLRLRVLVAVYSVEHEALVALGSSDVHVTSSPASTQVEATVLDNENEAARHRCARAVGHLRSAAQHLDMALAVFGPDAVQPPRSPDSVVSESTFEKAVNRARHRQREEELRAPSPRRGQR